MRNHRYHSQPFQSSGTFYNHPSHFGISAIIRITGGNFRSFTAC
jgi:hypothetical protein